MLDLVAVMYMYCSILLSDPNANTTDLANKAIVEVLPQPAQTTQDAVKKQNTESSDNVKIDYLEELKRLNYYKEDTDDSDLNIRNAVIHFQSDHNLVVDGEWGEHCLATLKKRLKAKEFHYTDTVETPASNEKWITINKTKRILTLYQGKAVVKKYPVAVGNPTTLTPEGKFTIVCKVKNPEWGGGGYTKPVAGGTPENPLGYRWMGLSIGGGSSYGVHGNNVPYSIGTDASHGCVRMVNPDVESLFELVPIGTDIWIGTNDQIEEWGISQKEY